jgi:hypothetical protein
MAPTQPPTHIDASWHVTWEVDTGNLHVTEYVFFFLFGSITVRLGKRCSTFRRGYMLICECMFMVLTTRLSTPIALRSSFRNVNGERGAGAPGCRRVLGGNTSTYACYDNRLSYLCFSETNPSPGSRATKGYERGIVFNANCSRVLLISIIIDHYGTVKYARKMWYGCTVHVLSTTCLTSWVQENVKICSSCQWKPAR